MENIVNAEDPIQRRYLHNDCWGISVGIDLHSCNPETIRNASKIKKFVIELCKRIKVKRFGECKVVHFGEDEKVAGFSMIQLIETSLISGHFANKTNHIYLDVFSCKYFDPKTVTSFARDFFEANKHKTHITLRK